MLPPPTAGSRVQRARQDGLMDMNETRTRKTLTLQETETLEIQDKSQIQEGNATKSVQNPNQVPKT